ncbi:hypothetical protein GCM10010483_27340 [Actinokineospora diospyrosa]
MADAPFWPAIACATVIGAAAEAPGAGAAEAAPAAGGWACDTTTAVARQAVRANKDQRLVRMGGVLSPTVTKVDRA